MQTTSKRSLTMCRYCLKAVNRLETSPYTFCSPMNLKLFPAISTSRTSSSDIDAQFIEPGTLPADPDEALSQIREAVAVHIGRNDFQFWDEDAGQLWGFPKPEPKLVHFIDDDTGFQNWRKRYPKGYVLNTRRSPVPHDLVLHYRTAVTST